MDITWYGHSCFRIAERGKTTVITDPYSDSLGLPPLRIKGDVVTVSHNSPGHNALDTVKNYSYALHGPGEYEIGGTFISGIAMHNEGSQGGEVRYNVAYLIEHDELTVLHLGDLSHLPAQSMIEELGQVNVLLVPVGGGNGLRASDAAEVIALIEPNFIIPMHYALPGLHIQLDPVDRFLKAMGVSKVQEEDVLKVTPSSLPEQSQVILLRPYLQSE